MGESIMDAMISYFYITLPSNASIGYFPNNTQSSYRTKLSSPLLLNGEWEAGITEIFIPNNWFNIVESNNKYSVRYEVQNIVLQDDTQYIIEFVCRSNEGLIDFCFRINESIKQIIGIEDGIRFLPNEKESTIDIDISAGFELQIMKEDGSKILYILNLPIEDIVINASRVNINFRSSSQNGLIQKLYIKNKTPRKTSEKIIPLSFIQENAQSSKFISDIINANVQLLGLDIFVKFIAEGMKHEVRIELSNYAKIHLKRSMCPSFMQKFNYT